MAAGWQFWRNGVLVLDLADALVQFVGAASISGTGSVTNSLLAKGVPVWIYVSNKDEAVRDFYQLPEISVSGTTISWTVYGDEGGTLIYGYI